MQKILLLLLPLLSFYKRRNWDSENTSNLQLLNIEAGQIHIIYLEHELSALHSPVPSKKTNNCKEYDQDKLKSVSSDHKEWVIRQVETGFHQMDKGDHPDKEQRGKGSEGE